MYSLIFSNFLQRVMAAVAEAVAVAVAVDHTEDPKSPVTVAVAADHTADLQEAHTAQVIVIAIFFLKEDKRMP